MSSIQDFFDDQKSGANNNKINLREFREQLIKNGFHRPKFFLKVEERSPQHVSKVHNRLYEEQIKKNKAMEKKKNEIEKLEYKECTFAP